MRSRLITIALIVGCADAHPNPGCDDGMCPEGMICLAPPDQPRPICAALCDEEMIFCGDGTLCQFNRGIRVCWPGGDLPEGSVTSLDSRQCQRGLGGRADYESEPLLRVCEPLCESDAECRAGETCTGLTCAVPCTNPSGGPCAEGSTCVDGFCTNARRLARIDCDGDGDADCLLNGMCDDAVPGRMCVPFEGEP